LARQIAETIDLFKAILHDEEKPFAPCLFSSTWNTYQLGASGFRYYLGPRNTLHSRLTKQPPSLADILTQAGAPSESVCTQEQRRQAEKAVIARLASRAPEMEAGSSHIRLTKLEYGFPIYNARHSKAVIVVIDSDIGWSRKKDGLVYATGFCSVGNIHVYGKRRGRWQQIHADWGIFASEFGSTHKPVTPEDW